MTLYIACVKVSEGWFGRFNGSMTDTHNFVRKQTTGSLILKSGSATVVRRTENRLQVKKQQDRRKIYV